MHSAIQRLVRPSLLTCRGRTRQQPSLYYCCRRFSDGFLDRERHWDKLSKKSQVIAKLLADDGDQEEEPSKDLLFHQRRALSQAITLIESRNPSHQRESIHLLSYLLKTENNVNKKSNSFRLGIAGPPGAGKSTFVEAFGKFLLNKKAEHVNVAGEPNTMCEKLAVVCIDPSSAITGGSILGDKTRMAELSAHNRAFVRPSPTRNVLGGLAAYTEDVVSLCQVAGYDFVMVETVGLGQSEIEVKESVDMLMLMVPPGGGDDLQGIKKGIVEVSDMIVVTKADGSLLSTAKHTAADYRGALRMMSNRRAMQGWETPPIRLVSAHIGEGLQSVWDDICQFRKAMVESGQMRIKREQQQTYWLWKSITEKILDKTKNDPILKEKAMALQQALGQGKTTPRVAAAELVDELMKR